MIRARSNWQLKMERPVIVLIYRLFARYIGGYKFLLLTTTGRKTGRRRTVPIVYMPVDGALVVVAANLGSDLHPGWFLNLKHNPQAQIQIGSAKMAVLSEEASVQERERLWANWIQENPGYKTFQEKTTRKLPVVILKPPRQGQSS